MGEAPYRCVAVRWPDSGVSANLALIIVSKQSSWACCILRVVLRPLNLMYVFSSTMPPVSWPLSAEAHEYWLQVEVCILAALLLHQDVLPRHSELVDPAVANVDHALLVFALEQPPVSAGATLPQLDD